MLDANLYNTFCDANLYNTFYDATYHKCSRIHSCMGDDFSCLVLSCPVRLIRINDLSWSY